MLQRRERMKSIKLPKNGILKGQCIRMETVQSHIISQHVKSLFYILLQEIMRHKNKQ